MKFPTLYSRRSDGGIQVWTIEVVGNQYRVHSGIKDGQIVTAEWTTCAGKNLGRSNETTPEAQAESEAKSKWTKKRGKGYSETPDAVDNHGIFEPMLAKHYKDQVKKVLAAFRSVVKVFSSAKYNGQRCTTRDDGMWTRGGSGGPKPIVACPHVFEALAPLFEAHPGLVLDGELYNHDLRHHLNRLFSITRKTKPEELTPELLAESKRIVEYHIYDAVNIGGLGEDALFSLRHAALVRAVADLNSPHIKIVDAEEMFSEEDVDAEYDRLLEEDWEGQIIRIDAGYQHSRTHLLLKRKPDKDGEYEIVDILPGEGNWSGTAKTAVCKLPDGTTFNPTLKGTYEDLQVVLAEKAKYIGKMATVVYQELSEYGVPQFCRIPYGSVVLDREDGE